MDAFAQELNTVQTRLRQSVSYDDIKYFNRCEIAGRICTILGFATAWLFVNPISIILIAIGQTTRWGLAHHILHRAFDNIPNCPTRFRGSHFARGWRRLLDWNDWMLPAAFQHEHNVHHVYTGAHEDPDVVEANLEFVRQSRQPKWIKYIMITLIACTWRLSYYAPGTFIQLRRKQKGLRATPYEFKSLIVFPEVFNPFTSEGRRFWLWCILPTFLTRFILIPAAFLPISTTAAIFVLANTIAAELLCNLYTFILIASSHTADDIYRFDESSRGQAEFYRHQLLGTVNYMRGPAIRDFLQIWINYQIEHHLFPNLPPSKYVACSKEVEAICNRHNIPYRYAPLRRRMWCMVNIIVGNTSMPWHATEPATKPNDSEQSEQPDTRGHIAA